MGATLHPSWRVNEKAREENFQSALESFLRITRICKIDSVSFVLRHNNLD